jgi:hypothetical protein
MNQIRTAALTQDPLEKPAGYPALCPRSANVGFADTRGLIRGV